MKKLDIITMNKWLELLIGLVLLVGMILVGWASSAYAWALFGKNLNFLNAAWVLLKGSVFWMVVLIGLVLVVIGISDLKE